MNRKTEQIFGLAVGLYNIGIRKEQREKQRGRKRREEQQYGR